MIGGGGGGRGAYFQGSLLSELYSINSGSTEQRNGVSWTRLVVAEERWLLTRGGQAPFGEQQVHVVSIPI